MVQIRIWCTCWTFTSGSQKMVEIRIHITCWAFGILIEGWKMVKIPIYWTFTSGGRKMVKIRRLWLVNKQESKYILPEWWQLHYSLYISNKNFGHDFNSICKIQKSFNFKYSGGVFETKMPFQKITSLYQNLNALITGSAVRNWYKVKTWLDQMFWQI